MTEIFKVFKNVFLNPREFFNSVKDETKYSRPLLFFSISYIAIAFLSSILTSIVYIIKNPTIGIIRVILSLFNFPFVISFAFATPFIAAGVTHLGVMMFGGKNSYYNTFKAITYASLVGMFYWIILSIINLIYTIMFTSFDLAEQNQTITSQAIIYLAIIGLISIISFFHILIVQKIGVSMFQQISEIRALMGIIIIPLILFIIIVLFFSVLLFILIGQIAPTPTGMVTALIQ